MAQLLVHSCDNDYHDADDNAGTKVQQKRRTQAVLLVMMVVL
jgi:hypothetical protein